MGRYDSEGRVYVEYIMLGLESMLLSLINHDHEI